MENLGAAISEEELEQMKNKLEAAEALAEQTQEIVQELQEPERREYTEAEQKAAVEEGQRIVEEDPEAAVICQAMVISRQLYWMGRIALQRKLQELDEQRKKDGLAEIPGIEELLVMNVASHGDQLKFTSQQVMHGLATVVLGFVNQEAERDVMLLQQMEQAQKQAQEAENGKEWELAPGLSTLRSRSVIVLPNERKAWPELSKAILDTILAGNEVKGTRKVNVLHITDKLKNDELNKKSDVGTKHYVEVGVNKMMASCNSHGNFDKAMTPWLRLMHKNRVDLILIDDIQPLRVPASSWQSPVKVSEEAHRVIRKWADENDCAVVACLPLSDDERVEHADALAHLSQFVQMVDAPLTVVEETQAVETA